MSGNPEVGVKWRILVAVRDIERMPDGTPVPPELAHTLLVLAMYWPRIWPSQATLAAHLKIKERQINRRLLALERAGLITRKSGRTGRNTHYQLALKLISSLGPADTVVEVPETLSWATDQSIDSPQSTADAPLDCG